MFLRLILALFSCYVSWVPSLPSSVVDCSFFVSVHAVSVPPPETKLVLTGTGILAYMHPLDKKVRCVACYSEGGAWRRSIGRRLVFSFLSRGCSQDARAQRVGKDDDQKVKIHKRYGWYKLNITHIWLICTRSVLFVTTGYRTWLLPWTHFFLELPGTAVSRIV